MSFFIKADLLELSLREHSDFLRIPLDFKRVPQVFQAMLSPGLSLIACPWVRIRQAQCRAISYPFSIHTRILPGYIIHGYPYPIRNPKPI